MYLLQRSVSFLPELDFDSDRSQAPLVGFLVAMPLGVALWATVAWGLWALLH